MARWAKKNWENLEDFLAKYLAPDCFCFLLATAFSAEKSSLLSLATDGVAAADMLSVVMEPGTCCCSYCVKATRPTESSATTARPRLRPDVRS